MRLIDIVCKSDVLETYAELYDVFDDNQEIRKELDRVYDKLNGLNTYWIPVSGPPERSEQTK